MEKCRQIPYDNRMYVMAALTLDCKMLLKSGTEHPHRHIITLMFGAGAGGALTLFFTRSMLPQTSTHHGMHMLHTSGHNGLFLHGLGAFIMA